MTDEQDQVARDRATLAAWEAECRAKQRAVHAGGWEAVLQVHLDGLERQAEAVRREMEALRRLIDRKLSDLDSDLLTIQDDAQNVRRTVGRLLKRKGGTDGG